MLLTPLTLRVGTLELLASMLLCTALYMMQLLHSQQQPWSTLIFPPRLTWTHSDVLGLMSSLCYFCGCSSQREGHKGLSQTFGRPPEARCAWTNCAVQHEEADWPWIHPGGAEGALDV